MAQVSFCLGDPDDPLSLAYARAQGCRIALRGEDGNALILTPDDDQGLSVVHFRCTTCRRSGLVNGHCSHEVWVAQLRPCECCQGTMVLGEWQTAWGESFWRFECPDCGNIITFERAREERRVGRHLWDSRYTGSEPGPEPGTMDFPWWV